MITASLPVFPQTSAVESRAWTLESTAARVIEVAPEMQESEAHIAARAGDLKQAGAWPNPTLDVRAGNRLGLEDGSGGMDLTEIAISQPLPLRRLARQRAAAEAGLQSAQAERRHRQLLLEREGARVFHALQLATAKQQLAQERLQLVEEFQAAGLRKKGDPLVRYLAPVDRKRLALLHEEAQQELIAADTDQQRRRADFSALLTLPADLEPRLTSLRPPSAPPGLQALEDALEQRNPALLAAFQDAEAAQASIALAKSQRTADPTLHLFRERDVFDGGRGASTGIGISVQLPLWNAGGGGGAKAQAEADQARVKFTTLKREVRNTLRQNHIELSRLLEQAERYRTHMLEPAREVFDLTRKGFAAGEINVLVLMEAYNTYFAVRARYLDLLQQAAVAAAELRVAAGVSLLTEVRP